MLTVTPESPGLLVKPELARMQMDAETKASETVIAGDAVTPGVTKGKASSPVSVPGTAATAAPAAQKLRRFHGTVRLDATRVGRDASRIAEEVIAHLSGQVDAEVVVTLEIAARLPNGATDQVVRTVTENSRTLKFDSHGFERE